MCRPVWKGYLPSKPDHPSAIHLYIHLVEASDRPERAEPYADKLAALMPGAGHIVHMPSHIYYRVGRVRRFAEVQSGRVRCRRDLHFTDRRAMGVYPIGYYSHNVHFVLVSAQLLGDTETVLSEADKLDKWLSNDVAAAIPIAQPVKAAPYFAWAQYADADKIMALPDPAGAPPYVKAMWHYARGVALASKKDVAGARKEAAAIESIETGTDWSTLDAWAIPARPVLGVAQSVVLARAAQADGDNKAAIDQWRQAVATEDTIPYMEPPFWYYPVRQSLGAALLKEGQADEAAKAFSAALEQSRGQCVAALRGRATAKVKGDTAAQTKAASEFAKAWRGVADDVEPGAPLGSVIWLELSP